MPIFNLDWSDLEGNFTATADDWDALFWESGCQFGVYYFYFAGCDHSETCRITCGETTSDMTGKAAFCWDPEGWCCDPMACRNIYNVRSEDQCGCCREDYCKSSESLKPSLSDLGYGI